MPIPQHLIYIVFVQGMVFLATKMIFRKMGFASRTNVLIVVSIALVFGMLMDVVLGAYGIFGYTLDGKFASTIEPRQLPIAVLLFNAIASYGLAVATVALAGNMFILPEAPPTLWKHITIFILILGLFGITVSDRASIMMVFSWGVVIISGGELLLGFVKRTGAVLALFTYKNYTPVFRMWAFSMFIGLVYEIVNWRFPFWVWLPGSHYDSSTIRLLIVVVGYFALIHPISIVWYLVTQKNTGVA